MSTLLTWLRPGLLALAVLVPAAPALAQQPTTDTWYVMDREGWIRTDDSRLVLTTYDLHDGPNLAAVPFQIGDWTGQDLVITNEETFPTLDAEQIVYRGYSRADGQMLVFSLVGGTRGQSFHHPLVCYQWAGWDTEDWGTTSIPIDDGEVVMRVVVGRDPDGPAQIDLHAYLWPNDSRDWADGATQIRVTALATQGEDQALEAARSFARLLFAHARRPGESTALPSPTTPAAGAAPMDAPTPAAPDAAPVAPDAPPTDAAPTIPAFR